MMRPSKISATRSAKVFTPEMASIWPPNRLTVRHDYAVEGPSVEYEEPIDSDRRADTN